LTKVFLLVSLSTAFSGVYLVGGEREKRVVVLGGGAGGFVASKKLAALARESKANVKITLITDSEWHYFHPLYVDVAFNGLDPEATRGPITGLSRFGVEVLVDPAVKIDAANRTVLTKSGKKIQYDYLIVSLGVKYGWDAYPGLNRYGYHNYTVEGALELRKALQSFRGGRIVILVPEWPVRCGMYPYEISTMIAEAFKARGIKSEVVLMDLSKEPLGGLGPDVSRVWKERLELAGVEHVVHNGLTEVDGEKRVVRAGNVEEKYDLLIKVPPSRLPDVLAASEGFQCQKDTRWARVRGPDFRHPDYDDIYMVGEHSMPLVGMPTAGIPVHHAAEFAAEKVMADIIGSYTPQLVRAMIPCVGYFGLDGYAGYCESRFNSEKGKYELSCYTISRSPLVRLVKESFYKAWVASLR
jgi:sulfide:quinone oxidoreductase